MADIVSQSQRVDPYYTDFYRNGVLDFHGDPGYGISRTSYDSKPERIRSRKIDNYSVKIPGWLMPKSYFRLVYTQTGVDGTLVEQHGIDRTERFGNFTPLVGYADAPFFYDDDFEYRAEIQAMLKIKDVDLNAAVALGEARNTAELAATAFKRLADGLTAIRRKDRSLLKKALGINPRKSFHEDKLDLRGKWLEHKFGWLPVVSDVQGAFEELRKQNGERPPVITGKGTVRAREKQLRTWLHGTNNVVRAEITDDRLAYCRLDFLPKNYLLAAAKSTGFTNPASVAWDLLPLSWLADYFVPFGDYIAAHDYAVGLEWLSGSITQRVEQVEVISSGEPGSNTVHWRLSGNRRKFAMRRRAYDTPPTPFIPRPKPIPSFNKFANALAALTMVFGGRHRNGMRI